mmetsp:Transcript_11556/g.16971  ORF Transcript_11556/g.16971 Transcript_11556/m.16971 type:complete len:147 (-) Transcript_11556:4112-4552(-)
MKTFSKNFSLFVVAVLVYFSCLSNAFSAPRLVQRNLINCEQSRQFSRVEFLQSSADDIPDPEKKFETSHASRPWDTRRGALLELSFVYHSDYWVSNCYWRVWCRRHRSGKMDWSGIHLFHHRSLGEHIHIPSCHKGYDLCKAVEGL